MPAFPLDPAHWLGLAAAVFGAGFLDAVAGGGGLLSLPAFLAAGLPPGLALGTNKLVAVNATGAGALRHARGGMVRRDALPLAAVSLAGAMLGASSALALPERLLKGTILVLLAAALAAVLLKPLRGGEGPARRGWPAGVWAGAAALGFYDGFFGPGTGTFLIALLAAVGGLGLAEASGNAKLLNFGSNLGAAAVFSCRGAVAPALALSLVPVIVAGAWLGASTALRRGAPFIRALMAVTVLALCARLGWDLWRG